MSKYITRLVDKELIKEQVIEGKERGSRKGLVKPMDSVQEAILLDEMIRISWKKERTTHKEMIEVEK